MVVSLPKGKAGIRETLKLMRLYVLHWKTEPLIRDLAIRIVRDVPAKDKLGEAIALLRFVRANIRYVNDIVDEETLQTPGYTLEMQAGDCDDMCVLLASLLESIGIRTAFVALAFAPDQFEHVFMLALLSEHWTSLEPTENVPVGWWPPGVEQTLGIVNVGQE
jgi:transglutaminase-like putative cysteine protease